MITITLDYNLDSLRIKNSDVPNDIEFKITRVNEVEKIVNEILNQVVGCSQTVELIKRDEDNDTTIGEW